MQAKAGVCAFLKGSVLAVRGNFKKVQRTNYCVAYKVYFIKHFVGLRQHGAPIAT